MKRKEKERRFVAVVNLDDETTRSDGRSSINPLKESDKNVIFIRCKNGGVCRAEGASVSFHHLVVVSTFSLIGDYSRDVCVSVIRNIYRLLIQGPGLR